MDAVALIQQATSTMSGGILTDVWTVFSACVNILVVLAGGRIIYAAIKQEPIIPAGMFGGGYNEDEYEALIVQEEKNYHQGILKNNAKLEVQDRHKYDF